MIFTKTVKDKTTFKKTQKTTRFKLITTIKEILLGLLGLYDDAHLQNMDELTLGYLDDKE